jgi:hypothetical protein
METLSFTLSFENGKNFAKSFPFMDLFDCCSFSIDPRGIEIAFEITPKKAVSFTTGSLFLNWIISLWRLAEIPGRVDADGLADS